MYSASKSGINGSNGARGGRCSQSTKDRCKRALVHAPALKPISHRQRRRAPTPGGGRRATCPPLRPILNYHLLFKEAFGHLKPATQPSALPADRNGEFVRQPSCLRSGGMTHASGRKWPAMHWMNPRLKAYTRGAASPILLQN